MTTLPAGFTAKTITPPTPCVIWTGAVNSKGYPCYAVEGWSTLAHRIAYEAARGPIPEGMTIDHLCLVKRCVNPDHLEVVARSENTRRQWRKPGQCPQGHFYTAENTLTRTNKQTGHTQRECKTCKRESQRRWRENRKSA